VLTITQSTYDGILYNVEDIKEMLDGKIDTLHFDEAWLPHAAFHDFYGDYHAIGADRPRCKESMVFSTQSTHKLLAGLSQASQILVQDAENNKLDRDVFNEAYLMHTSTSPQYAIIASCDVAAAMMEPPGGTALVEESIAEALDFRRAMRKVDEEWGADWWFKVWGPDLSEEGIEEREAWMLKPGERWHGFGKLAEGFNMLDPIKATVITPGLDVDGDSPTGHPRRHRHQVPRRARRDRREVRPLQFFIMFTIGITKGRWNTLVTELQQFKDDYDKNQPLWKVLPEFVAKHPRYERVGLRDLCTQIHEVYKANDVARLTTEMYLSDMVPAMKPADAFAKMAHREIDRVPIDELEGRVTSVLLTPYPPGIPLLIPGRALQRAPSSATCKFARDFNERFPGFETDIHGLVKEGASRVRRRRSDRAGGPCRVRRAVPSRAAPGTRPRGSARIRPGFAAAAPACPCCSWHPGYAGSRLRNPHPSGAGRGLRRGAGRSHTAGRRSAPVPGRVPLPAGAA
jgi:arginine decarboxylase